MCKWGKRKAEKKVRRAWRQNSKAGEEKGEG